MTARPHFAKFSEPLLARARHLLSCVAQLPASAEILDPFAGVGKGVDYLHDVCGFREVVGIELEPEWAAQSRFVHVGNALDLPFPDNAFDAIMTSPTYGNRMSDRDMRPSVAGTYAKALGRFASEGSSCHLQWGCVAPGVRILRSDWRWVPVESLAVGDELIAFDEALPQASSAIRQRGRRFRRAEVLGAELASRACVQITFDDGGSLICTEDHPWLARRHDSLSGYRRTREWITAASLRPADVVDLFFQPQARGDTYEVGWLGGMLDGEGSVARPGDGGTGSLTISQKPGPTLEQIKRALQALGFRYHENVGSNANSLNVRGGFARRMELLVLTRPERLLSKVQFEGVAMRALGHRAVVEVRRIGRHDVVLLGTSTRTYFAEGMGSHNTQYREFHQDAWKEAYRVLKPGGWFLLNIKDHYRNRALQGVPEWHTQVLRDLGFAWISGAFVETPGQRVGANSELRVNGEWLTLFQLVDEEPEQ